MANFLLICDPDRDRAGRAARRAGQRIAFLPGQEAHFVSASEYSLVWTAAPAAPVAVHRADRPGGADCVLFGEPHDDAGDPWTAAALAAAGGGGGSLNGYYAALLLDPRAGVRAEADALGLFPLYYWEQAGVLLVATSPALFQCHPRFQPAPDWHGLAALLLTSGLVGGRTLWAGVRRLAPDHVLSWMPGGAPREIPPAAPGAATPAPALDEAVREAVSLHGAFLRAGLRASRDPGLLLSGGLDSRILAGLTVELGRRPACVTFGRAGDLDAHCATLVARTLELPQALIDVDPEKYLTFANLSVRWEQLSGGLYAIPLGWNLAVSPPPVKIDRMVCGLTLDAVVGGPKLVAAAGRELSFEQLRIGLLGYDRGRLDRLVAEPRLRTACEEVRGELLGQYQRESAADHLREWRMNLAHRQRFAVGACAWRYSLFAWPVLPALDRRLLRLVGRLPYPLVENRRIQKQILITRFPALARLALDRNYLDTAPLLGPPGSLGRDLRRRLVKSLHRCRAWLGCDPRFYVRTMEINSPGWRAVRSAAEQARATLRSFFHARPLDEALPGAHATVRRLADPIVHSTPLKNTVGLMLWMRREA